MHSTQLTQNNVHKKGLSSFQVHWVTINNAYKTGRVLLPHQHTLPAFSSFQNLHVHISIFTDT